MSDLGQSVNVSLTIADFVNSDPSGKVNVVGGGVQVVGYDVESGTTTPFAVMVEIRLPVGAFDREFAFELMLRRDDGNVVELPNPAGPQKMRIAQNMKAERPQTGGALAATLPPTMRFVMNLANGLPLRVDSAYYWEVRIDGETKDQWRAHFMVPGSNPGIVFG